MGSTGMSATETSLSLRSPSPDLLVEGPEVVIGLVDLIFGEDSEALVVEKLGRDAVGARNSVVSL